MIPTSHLRIGNLVQLKETITSSEKAICHRYGFPYVLYEEIDATFANSNTAAKAVDKAKDWYPNSNSILTISGICDDDVMLQNDVTRPMSDIEGINLTEEWMLKFGFIKILGSFRKESIGLEVFFDTIGSLAIYNYVDGDADIYLRSISPEVHVFQNFVFAFCDTELTIKQ